MKIIPQIVEQHTEETSFLWLQRNEAVKESHYSLKNLAELDERVEAHIDGLRIAGDDGWEICKSELMWEEPGEVFTAAVLAFESGIAERINEVIEIGIQDLDLARAVVSALGWLPFKSAKKYIDKFLTDEIPMLRKVGIAGYAVHRQNPPNDVFINFLTEEDVSVKIRTLKAVGELGRVDLLPYSKNNFQDENLLVSFNAALSASILGDEQAPFVVKLILPGLDKKYQNRAVRTVIRKMSLSDSNNWLDELKKLNERLAVIAVGSIGDPKNIPWLFEIMKINELARVAGESFTMITGVDLAYDDLESDWPEGFEAGPTENPEDEDVEMDEDEDLPWPNIELIKKWWEQNKNKFTNGTRYLIGKPIESIWMEEVLRIGMQRQRAAAAVELAMLNPGKPLFEVRAPGFRQKQLLFNNSAYKKMK